MALHATVRGLWLELHAWPLVAAAVLVLAPAVLVRSHPWVARVAGAGAAVLATITLAAPALDNSSTSFALASLVCLVVWSVILVVLPRTWAAVPTAPLVLAVIAALWTTVGLLAQASTAVLTVGDPNSRAAGVRLADSEALAHPGVLVPLVIGLLGAGVALSRWLTSPRGAVRMYVVPLAAVIALAGVATAALHAVPLAVVLGGIVTVVAALLGAALVRRDLVGSALSGAALILAVSAVTAALPSDWLTAAALAFVVAAGVLVLLRGAFPLAQPGAELVVPASVSGLIWALAEVAGPDPVLRAAPIVLVVGVMAAARPRLSVEASAWVSALVAATVSVDAASDESVALALHLTLAGGLITASSLINPSRRALGWVGGLLLAMATWVRLADLGVHAPEAYTLPSAVALTLVGLRHLWKTPSASTMVALCPGLTLATVPSLLQVMVEDPVSLRAMLLGLGCLALVLVGTRLHWSAPLGVGAVTGGLLVLRELGPYASHTPQWALIGLAGTVLTVVGVTWESRLHNLRHATAYLSRLR